MAARKPPPISAATTGQTVDVFAAHSELESRGWYLDRQGPPDSLHVTCMPVHLDVIDEFIADLRDAVRMGARADDRSTTYAAME